MAHLVALLVVNLRLALGLGLVSVLPDRGIFPELLPRVNLAAPAPLGAHERVRAWLRVDARHQLATLFVGEDPIALFPLVDGALAAAARAQLAALGAERARTVVGPPRPEDDRDGDGIVDRLDVLLGAKKLVANGAHYVENYRTLRYPGGDVPRDEGVCTDTVIRALRNAGLDLQREVHEDILRAPGAYPMVRRPNADIDQRRVKTLLPWFQRHFQTLPTDGDFQPGDVVFFDTFPERPGPDHLGVVGDQRGKSGLATVINNWAPGASDAEMDLLSWVPVTHHFRWPPSFPPGGSGGKSHAR